MLLCQQLIRRSVQQTVRQGVPHVTSPLSFGPHRLERLASTQRALISFDDTEKAFMGQSTASLVRSVLVFYACGFPLFVNNAAPLLKLSKAVIGEKLTMKLVKYTFYAQFCAGETDAELQSKIRALRARGVGSILDYAAEDDVPTTNDSQPQPQPSSSSNSSAASQQQPAAAAASSKPQDIGTSTATPAPTAGSSSSSSGDGGGDGVLRSATTGMPLLPAGMAVARQYPYSTEAQCDAHVKIFLSCIESASRDPGQAGFAAVKLTALGNPLLLERVSTAIREVRGLFSRWDSDGDGWIDKDEFHRAYTLMLPDASEEEKQRVFTWMDTQQQGKVDYVAWCQRLTLTRMPQYAARIAKSAASQGWPQSLSTAALTPEEVQLVGAMRERLARLATAASNAGVRLLIDAEHTYFQPAIDHLAMELMRRYNTGPEGAVIYNTWQAYLKDSESRLINDLERGRREGYILGAKLVRGAYTEIERRRAASLGYPSPVWDTLQDTHDSYNRCAQLLLSKVKEGKAEVMLGTHNQTSIELAVSDMTRLGLDPKQSHVYFGQLLGMSDHLTQGLGAAGYNAYKYTPYGRVDQVIPYLLRRASENSSILTGSKKDLVMLKRELWRRGRAALGWPAADSAHAGAQAARPV